MRTVAIIQARMGSSRLPGKVLLELEGRTVLDHVIRRVKRIPEIDEVVIATTTGMQDDPLVTESTKLGVDVYRGSELDVLSRYYEAARLHKADTVVRITSDCPLLEPEISSSVIRLLLESGADYASNCMERSYPRGLDTEVFRFEVLETAHQEAKEIFEREHVTPYLYRNPERFKLAGLKYESDLSDFRWTLDTPADWELIRTVYSHLYENSPDFCWVDIIDLYRSYPGLAAINGHIEQKKLTGDR